MLVDELLDAPGGEACAVGDVAACCAGLAGLADEVVAALGGVGEMTKPGRRPITLPDNHRRAYSKGFESALRRQAGL